MNLAIYPGLVALTLGGILLFPLAYPVVKLITRWPGDVIMRFFVWLYGRAWLALMRPFVRFSRVGFDNIPQAGGILVCNHLSFFDIFCMGALPRFDVVFTVRNWPFRMPWYGPFMRLAQYVNLEKLGQAAGLAHCASHLTRGALVHFFPEGHRSRDGGLQRFHTGAFQLAQQTGVAVVPICITGTWQLLPPKSFVMNPARVVLEALPPLRPQDFAADEAGALEMRHACRHRMGQALTRQIQQAAGETIEYQ